MQCASIPFVRAALAALLLACAGPVWAQDRTIPPPPRGGNGADDARTILQRYVEAWRGPDEMTLDNTLTVGFRFSGPGGGEYHAVFSPDGRAALADGLPDSTFHFHGDMAILRLSDPAPLDIGLPQDGWTPELQAVLLPFTFHFWNRSWPEVARFGDGTTRRVHGGEAAILYYQPGLRTAFYQLEPGMHVNEEASDQTNPFPSLFVVIRGAIDAHLDGLPRTLHEGEAVLVPAGMTHEFFVGSGGYGEMIMIAFGEGA